MLTNVHVNCISCEQIENIEHLIFGCPETKKKIWEKVSRILKLNITWTTIVVGFFTSSQTHKKFSIMSYHL